MPLCGELPSSRPALVLRDLAISWPETIKPAVKISGLARAPIARAGEGSSGFLTLSALTVTTSARSRRAPEGNLRRDRSAGRKDVEASPNSRSHDRGAGVANQRQHPRAFTLRTRKVTIISNEMRKKWGSNVQQNAHGTQSGTSISTVAFKCISKSQALRRDFHEVLRKLPSETLSQTQRHISASYTDPHCSQSAC